MAVLVGMAMVFLVVPLILNFYHAGYLVRRSQELHHDQLGSVPRLGGIALVAAFGVLELIITWFFPGQSSPHDRLVLVSASLGMFGLGMWDDLKPLGAKRKLLVQVLIASCVCFFGIGIMSFKIPFSGQTVHLGNWGFVFTILWLVGMTNLINVIDGVDGLAGGICLMLMALLAYVGHQTGSFELVAAGMAGALLGFLWFNFPPARIHLGDGGAYFLGFQIGFLSLVGSHKGTIAAALVATLFALAFAIVDMLLAILRRGLRGLPIFRPDRRHIHHRLLEMGFSRRKAVLSIYAVTVIFLVMGFLAFASEGQLVPVLLGIAVVILLFCAGKLNFSREWFAVGRVLGNSLEIRQQVQYALSLTHWLRLEGTRHASLESLWPNLVFVVQRLGFTSLSLTLADGVRLWQKPGAIGETQCRRRELRGGHSGVLELKAYANGSMEKSSPGQGFELEVRGLYDVAMLDPKVFEIISELVAEGWLTATVSWDDNKLVPLSFSSKPLAMGRPRGKIGALYPR